MSDVEIIEKEIKSTNIMGTTCTTLQHIEKEQVNRFGKPLQSKVSQNDFLNP